MRVISGTCKGLPLKAIDGVTTRPTTDKVKESVFNIIGPYFEGGQVLDLFAGSGALGIEALSRGADFAYFVEKDFQAGKLLQQNLSFCRLEQKSVLLRKDAFQAAKQLPAGVRFDYIFLDPPYKMAERIPEIIQKLIEENRLAEDYLIICEHGVESALPKEIGSAIQFRSEKYGTIIISFYHSIEGVS